MRDICCALRKFIATRFDAERRPLWVASLQRLRDIPGLYRTLMAHLRGATVSGDSAVSCGP